MLLKRARDGVRRLEGGLMTVRRWVGDRKGQ